jgi:hypothetical protein
MAIEATSRFLAAEERGFAVKACQVTGNRIG